MVLSSLMLDTLPLSLHALVIFVAVMSIESKIELLFLANWSLPCSSAVIILKTPQQRHHQDLHSSELETYAQMFLIICVLNAPYAAKAWLGYKMGARECAERKGALLHTNLQL